MAIKRYKYEKGQKLGSFTFINDEEDYIGPDGVPYRMARFICKCGNEFISRINQVKLKDRIGCKKCRKESILKSHITHGKSDTSEHNVWNMMIQRCTNEKYTKYEDYGGRGIKVCNRWLKSFINFYNDMGPRPSSKHKLERINNDGDYKKSNCKWVTQKEQVRNRRNTIYVLYNGRNRPFSEIIEEYGLNYNKSAGRLRNGWSLEKILTIE